MVDKSEIRDLVTAGIDSYLEFYHSRLLSERGGLIVRNEGLIGSFILKEIYKKRPDMFVSFETSYKLVAKLAFPEDEPGTLEYLKEFSNSKFDLVIWEKRRPICIVEVKRGPGAVLDDARKMSRVMRNLGKSCGGPLRHAIMAFPVIRKSPEAAQLSFDAVYKDVREVLKKEKLIRNASRISDPVKFTNRFGAGYIRIPSGAY